jgi:hypothetical protein
MGAPGSHQRTWVENDGRSPNVAFAESMNKISRARMGRCGFTLRSYFKWIVMPEEIRNRFWSLPARLGNRVYP